MVEMSDEFSEQWIEWRRRVDLSGYDARWEQLESKGEAIHGEADFICGLLDPTANQVVMDAGCGSGRVGMEVARRGFSVVGVDNDPEMLALARPKTEFDAVMAARVRWELGNLSDIRLADRFDMIALAGNVLVYARAEDRQPAIGNLSDHLRSGGLLVAGSGSAPGYDPETHRSWCEAIGLVLVDRYSTWDQDPYDGGRYAVSVFRKPV